MHVDALDIPPAAFSCEFVVAADIVDAQGRVSNDRIVYLLSKAANLHSDAMGWTFGRYRQLGSWWVVRRHEVDYHGPAALDDRLICRTWISAMTGATSTRRHVLYRKDDGAVVAVGTNVWVLIDIATSRPVRIPPKLQKTFNPENFPLS